MEFRFKPANAGGGVKPRAPGAGNIMQERKKTVKRATDYGKSVICPIASTVILTINPALTHGALRQRPFQGLKYQFPIGELKVKFDVKNFRNF
jgi:hypothetical protein